MRSHRPLICAHRGASADHADSSVEAFAAAIAAGADLVETDIRRGPDGTLVLSHDAVQPGEEPIPLTALLDLALHRVGLDLELKEPGLEADLLSLLRREHRERLIVTSFLPEVVAEFRRLDPTLDLGLLVEDGPDYALPRDLLTAVRECGADFLSPDVTLLGPDTRRVARVLGRGLSVWTVNDREQLEALARDPDVAIITTDVPELARAVIAGL